MKPTNTISLHSKKEVLDTILTTQSCQHHSNYPKHKKVATPHPYGFNGMEKDDEVKGANNSLDFGARIYDNRIGRWLSRDPRIKDFPGCSPYNFAANNPIFYVDKNGEAPEAYPGILFTYLNLDSYIGIGAGYYAGMQVGVARDEVGKTHYRMVTYLYTENNVGTAVGGAGVSVTFDVKISWKAETFKGMLDKTWKPQESAEAGVGVGLGINLGFGWEEITLGLGIGAELGFKIVRTNLDEGISLTYYEADYVNEKAIGAKRWTVNSTNELNEDGLYEGTVIVPGHDNTDIDTGIKVFSTNGIYWWSIKYKEESDKAENED